MKNSKGFTLIELLIVIAIIGILGAVAMVFYRNQFIIKARLTEVTNSISVLASAVHSYYIENERFPNASDISMIKDSLGVSIPAGVNFKITSLKIESGKIIATIGNLDPNIDGRTIILNPTTDQYGTIRWNWSGSIQSNYLPKR